MEKYYCREYQLRSNAGFGVVRAAIPEKPTANNENSLLLSINPIYLPKMIEKLHPDKHHAVETLHRSIVKTVSYRVVILILDFTAIYLFTGKIKIALGFMIVSNIYTTLGYFIHERIWDRIKWGKIIYKKVGD
jgi:adenylylsulfate kinase